MDGQWEILPINPMVSQLHIQLYLGRVFRSFVMYRGVSGPSLLIEFTDSMIA